VSVAAALGASVEVVVVSPALSRPQPASETDKATQPSKIIFFMSQRECF
jgi:hypothetical protein